MSEVQSLPFPVTVNTPTGTRTKMSIPIKLRVGMEKDFVFSICNQKEGERIVEAYIHYTFRWHKIQGQLRQIAKTEDREGWEEAKNEEEEVMEQIKALQQNTKRNHVKDFEGDGGNYNSSRNGEFTSVTISCHNTLHFFSDR